jgi:cold shock CspA family protein
MCHYSLKHSLSGLRTGVSFDEGDKVGFELVKDEKGPKTEKMEKL